MRATRATGALAPVLCLTVLACSSSADLGGVWRATAPSDNALVFQGPDDPVGVEMVLGQYGGDVAGLVRFYHRGPLGEFDHARRAATPDRECECVYLQQGKANPDTGALSFVLQGCLPGSATEALLRVRGGLQLGADGRLTGTLTVDQPGSPLDKRQVELEFDRHAARVDVADLQCETPVDASDGNTRSGL